MKYLFSLAIVAILALSGCSSHDQGSKTVTVTRTWNNKRVVDNPLVETIKAVKGTPTGNTGRGFQATRHSSWTDSNMPKHWR